MAEDPNSPLNVALAELGTTIGTITGKVEAGKQRVREYKGQIIAKLGEVIQQLNTLRTNNNLSGIPELKQQLQASQNALQEKTQLLNDTQKSLDEANTNLRDLQARMTDIDREMATKTAEIERLMAEGGQKDASIQDLNNQIQELTKQKADIEGQYANAQQQSNSLIQKIGQINTTLARQIDLIDTIVAELGNLDNASDEVAMQFKAVGDNIMAIMNMLNENAPAAAAPAPAAAAYDAEKNFDKLMELDKEDKEQFTNFKRKLDSKIGQIIDNNIRGARDGNPEAINAIKDALRTSQKVVPDLIIRGGKSRRHRRRNNRRKTMKKRHRKTMKRNHYRGGYVYTSSKELDNASSIVSTSTDSLSKSLSKSSMSSSAKKDVEQEKYKI